MDVKIDNTAADKLLRDAGYDPELVRGYKSNSKWETDTERRQRWAARNRLAGDARQRGLVKSPRRGADEVHTLSGLGAFIAGYIVAKWF